MEGLTAVEKVVIDGGLFLMGETAEPVDLAEFQIAQYPVTNAAYYEFVQETNRRRPDHWPLDGRYPPALARHPVVFVSWEDAAAFTEWLGASLPSEAEWEKAARGTDGRIYPWGNEFAAENCNTSESKTEGTKAVDAHPDGASPYGVMDMAGNVWEWTTTFYQEGEDWRVLKGGAWDYKGMKDARCASRIYFRPTFRNSAVGFRCCWHSNKYPGMIKGMGKGG
jgi:formylglycine-generating enzyme required for sulfatase activity